MTTTDPTAAYLSPHELAAWRGLLEVHARVTQELDSQMQAEHGLSLFLDHLTATDQIVLGDIWSRLR